jgi:CHAT domain-containing protein
MDDWRTRRSRHSRRHRIAHTIALALAMALASGCAQTGGSAPPAGGGRGRGVGVRAAGRLNGSGNDALDAFEAIRRGEAAEALDRFRGEAVAREGRGDLPGAADADLAVLILARRLGRYQEAIGAGQRALELLARVTPGDETRRRQLSIYGPLGAAYVEAGDRAQARRYFEEGLRLVGAVPNEGPRLLLTGVFSLHLARLARVSGDPALALRYGDEAVRALSAYVEQVPSKARFTRQQQNGRRLLTSSLVEVGEGGLDRGQLGEAEKAFGLARRLGSTVGSDPAVIGAIVGLGRVAMARRDYTGAADRFREADAIARRLNSVPQLIQIDAAMAAAAAAQGQHAEALAAYQRGLERVESVRSELQESALRSGFLDNKQGMYQGAVRSALTLGLTADAFAYAERGRARAFLDLLGNQVLSKGKTQALLDEEVRLRTRLAEARAFESGPESELDEAPAEDPAEPRERIEAAERAYRAFLERVRAESREQASLMTVEPVSLREVQGLLPAGTTLLEYLVTGPETLLWVIDRDEAHVVRVPLPRRDLVAQLQAFRAAIGERAPTDRVETMAHALGKRLLEPARVWITGDRLLIVPHDVLHYLPFAALRDGEGRWLVEDYAVATLPSASVLRFLAEKGTGPRAGVLAVGDPDVGSAPRLRYAEREARAVAARYPGATLLVREQATKAKTEAQVGQAGLIHFATHGELNEADPLGSALLLAPEGEANGRLEVREVLGLDLHARLVVLSACETGLGQLSRGDELVGLQRAFLYAGTPAVVTTLWKVDDRASYELMREFYRHLDAEGPALALRAAQRAVMREFPEPFAWAAFGLTGVPR